MDPDACLTTLRLALRIDDLDFADELRTALRVWVANGGFEPSDPDWRDV